MNESCIYLWMWLLELHGSSVLSCIWAPKMNVLPHYNYFCNCAVLINQSCWQTLLLKTIMTVFLRLLAFRFDRSLQGFLLLCSVNFSPFPSNKRAVSCVNGTVYFVVASDSVRGKHWHVKRRDLFVNAIGSLRNKDIPFSCLASLMRIIQRLPFD